MKHKLITGMRMMMTMQSDEDGGGGEDDDDDDDDDDASPSSRHSNDTHTLSLNVSRSLFPTNVHARKHTNAHTDKDANTHIHTPCSALGSCPTNKSGDDVAK